MFAKFKWQFLKYLDDFSIIDDAEELLNILSNGSAFLPNDVCDDLALPFESNPHVYMIWD